MCEEILTGGRITAGVVRIGDTVHRSPCGNSGFVRDVLSHLERRGADFAPRWLGVDEQGREVFALPGMVDVPGSIAPLRLLRDGANLCTCAQDILDDMRWTQTTVPAKSEPAPASAQDNLTEPQKRIFALLEREEMHFEELAEKTGLTPDQLSGELTMMELDGLIEARAGRAYALKR